MSDVLVLGLGESMKHAPHLKIDRRPYKTGNPGVAISVPEANAKIREGMHDLRVRACSGQMLEAEGDPRDPIEQARALLRQVRKRTVYVQDQPRTEFIAAAVQTLCLDDKGFCLRAGDCDDLLVAYACLAMAIGFHWRTIIARYDKSPIFTHIYGAIRDPATGEWLRVDPASKLPLGQVYPADEERYFDPLADGVPAGLGGENAPVAFIGVGRMPSGKVISCTSPPIDWTEPRLRVANATGALARAVAGLDRARARADRRGLDDAGCFPSPPTQIVGTRRWTETTSALAADLAATARHAVTYGEEAVRGERRIYGKTELLVQGRPTDPFVLQSLATSPEGPVVAVRDPKTQGLLGGFTLPVGKLLSPSAIDALGAAVPALGGVAITAALLVSLAELVTLTTSSVDAMAKSRPNVGLGAAPTPSPCASTGRAGFWLGASVGVAVGFAGGFIASALALSGHRED